jgi:hypothetical protein
MNDDRNPNNKTKPEVFDAPASPPGPGPSITPDASYRHTATTPEEPLNARDEPMDVEPAARGTPWVWVAAILLLLIIAYLVWR